MKKNQAAAPNAPPDGPTERSAAKPSTARAPTAKPDEPLGADAREIFSPLTEESLSVLTFLHIHHAADVIGKAVERDLATRGLSVSRYSILRLLTRREPMPLSWIADKHFSQRSNITAVVDRLVRDGLVERLPDPVDRRVIRVQLTALGRETVDAARTPHLEFLANIMSPLDPDDMRRLVDLLDKLTAPLDGGGKRIPRDL